MLGKTKRIHFVGIGGIGMSGLALIFQNLKFRVSGSDINPSDITRHLARQGIRIHYGHRMANSAGADVVVYSTAVPLNNPELIAAQRRGIPVIHRSELLAELTRIKTSVCISGTHGKTTTTSLVSEVIHAGRLSPTSVIGGIVKGKSQARVGTGEYLVCEADESDKSFLKLLPAYAVITNIEPEHLEHYRDFEEIKESFIHFANHVPFWGCVFIGVDAPGIPEIRDAIKRRIVGYGLVKQADLQAVALRRTDFGTNFRVVYHGRSLGEWAIHLPGRHNVLNSLAAIGVGLELGIPVDRMRRVLKRFRGVRRRIECVAVLGDIRIFDDYGHHPTEIAVTLKTLREYFPKNRIISIFQPHRYTRTYYLFDRFADAFIHANSVIVTDIYPAHETPIPGVTAAALARRIAARKKTVIYLADFDQIVARIKKTVKPGDIIVIQGAGTINRITRQLVQEIS